MESSKVKFTSSAGKEVELEYSRRAQMRIESLPNFAAQIGVLAQLCNMLWALQSTKNPKNTPEDFADLLVTDEDIVNAGEAVNEAMEVASPKKPDTTLSGQDSE